MQPVIHGIPGVDADHAVHGPGGQLHTFEGQRQHEGEQVHVILVVGIIVRRPAVGGTALVPVVVEQTGPESCQANIFVELVVGYDSGGIVKQHRGATGHIGHGEPLDTHTELEVGIGHRPVDIGVSQFHDGLVSAQGAAGRCLAPHGVADFEVDRTGQRLGSHRIQLQTHELHGTEGVIGIPGLIRRRTGLAGMAHEGTIPGPHAHQPHPLGFEIDSVSTTGSPQQHARSERKSHQLLHDKTFLPK